MIDYNYLAQGIIPFIFFMVIFASALKREKVFENFTVGAQNGLKIVFNLLPTLIGLLIGVGCLSASGFLNMIGDRIGDISDNISIFGTKIVIPSSIIPLSITKIFSSSAATGIMLDIFKNEGVDSLAGRMAALILSSTETLLYTISIYCMSIKVNRSKWMVPGALICIIAGVIASIFICNISC